MAALGTEQHGLFCPEVGAAAAAPALPPRLAHKADEGAGMAASIAFAGGLSAWGQPGPSPLDPSPAALPSPPMRSQAPRKRHMPSQMPQVGVPTLAEAEPMVDAGVAAAWPGAVPSGLIVGSAAACAGDEEVAALLPKMKRMRLRPSIGQLRLQREAEEAAVAAAAAAVQGIHIEVLPEQLRALVVIGSRDGRAVHLELSFPPQYPHRPPRVQQLAPNAPLPCWRYEGSSVTLPRLSDRSWSPAMGLADIVRDLVQGPPEGLRAEDQAPSCASSLGAHEGNAQDGIGLRIANEHELAQGRSCLEDAAACETRTRAAGGKAMTSVLGTYASPLNSPCQLDVEMT